MEVKRDMKLCAGIFTFFFFSCLLSYVLTKAAVLEVLAITFGVTAYHFVMRFLVGGGFHRLFHNHVDYRKKWFQVSSLEKKFYDRIKIKKWKSHMPTYEQDFFDVKNHSMEEITGAMCQAELVHETIMMLSFLPVVLARWFSPACVFVLTSVAAAFIDLLFVMMQRFNRQRMVKLINGKKEYKK
ncbi:MAG: hypothetical protein Q4D60_10705 [Eubacteriales bacterium]|nr:hypothetical protein [Eubacteriales bacterium]